MLALALFCSQFLPRLLHYLQPLLYWDTEWINGSFAAAIYLQKNLALGQRLQLQ
jgi:hypothetical protein